MGQMVVRNIPDDVLDRFKSEAKRQGKSAEQLAREAIEQVTRLNREELVQQLRDLRSDTKPIDLQTAERLMNEAREDRDMHSSLVGLEHDR